MGQRQIGSGDIFMKKRRRKKALRIFYGALLLFLLGIGAASASYGYDYVKQWDSLIYPGIKVENIDISGMSKLSAKNTIKKNFSDTITNRKINIKTPAKTYVVDLSQLDAKHNIDDVVNKAFAYGKNLSLYQRYNLIKKPVSQNFVLTLSYDSKKLDAIINTIDEETNVAPLNASIKMVSGKFQVSSGRNGRKLNKESLTKTLTDDINKSNTKDSIIDAPFTQVQAGTTAEMLAKVNTKVSSFNTEYGSKSSAERANNIAVAVKAINGTVLMPGDVFSFNDIVGKRTAEKGYKEAPVIVGNKVETDFGGGICQVSSTLYNAILRANVKATERTHHTLPSSYVSLGMDATVDFGNIDYKFKNTLSYPMYIESYTYNGNICFNIYSDASLTSKKYELYNNVYKTISPGITYIDDSSMPVGKTEEVQKAYTGYKVKVYKKTIQSGAVTNEELISDDYYRPVDAVIKRGTKK